MHKFFSHNIKKYAKNEQLYIFLERYMDLNL